MSVLNMASLAVAKEVVFPWIRAQRAIFGIEMLWEICQKFNVIYFCFCKLLTNIFIQKVILVLRFMISIIHTKCKFKNMEISRHC